VYVGVVGEAFALRRHPMLINRMLNLCKSTNGEKALVHRKSLDEAPLPSMRRHVGVIAQWRGQDDAFKILHNEQELDNGIIVRSQSLRLGYLSRTTMESTRNAMVILERSVSAFRVAVPKLRGVICACLKTSWKNRL